MDAKNEIYAALLNWAVLLSGYPIPEHSPDVVFVTHPFLEQKACNNKPCKVAGWYNGHNTIYLDDRLNMRST
ncbi:MAG: hypothetical protein ACRENT_06655, partial [Thermodesulfobacteriota bacterium]